MLKILCLHGAGTNGEVLKAQTANLRSLLSHHYDWLFVDAEEDCAPAPGAEGIFPPPFLCFHLEPSCENIQEAVELLDDIIDTEGPFDAVMGFSQGGALAATMLMRHQTLRPFESPPFRVAIFLCAHLPWSWNVEHGYDVTTLLMKGRSNSVQFDEWQKMSALPWTKQASDEYLKDLPESIQQRIQEKAESLADAETPKFRRFHPEASEVRVTIPTVHLCGIKDRDYNHSLKLVELCESDTTQVIEHAGGHEIPRDADISKAFRDAVERAITRAELMM